MRNGGKAASPLMSYAPARSARQAPRSRHIRVAKCFHWSPGRSYGLLPRTFVNQQQFAYGSGDSLSETVRKLNVEQSHYINRSSSVNAAERICRPSSAAFSSGALGRRCSADGNGRAEITICSFFIDPSMMLMESPKYFLMIHNDWISSPTMISGYFNLKIKVVKPSGAANGYLNSFVKSRYLGATSCPMLYSRSRWKSNSAEGARLAVEANGQRCARFETEDGPEAGIGHKIGPVRRGGSPANCIAPAPVTTRSEIVIRSSELVGTAFTCIVLKNLEGKN
ncbi:unnamed protein product [Nesidiocoris tenuis]|uniref:Uncharacterized protein n=1 Tax=Nesidiocoris tenuis TaxID=355587 RepID=A0A6H5GSJ5_9HEMI|nr:unnamed protein product [Nesidiocoris tenuis]